MFKEFKKQAFGGWGKAFKATMGHKPKPKPKSNVNIVNYYIYKKKPR